jgi:hypothetical protein
MGWLTTGAARTLVLSGGPATCMSTGIRRRLSWPIGSAWFHNLDKDEARTVADALLAKERRANPKPRVRRVPVLFRTADSVRLGREREWELFCQARRNTFATWGASLALVAAPLALLGLFWLFMRHPISAWYAVAIEVAVLVPTFLVVFHLRKELLTSSPP